MQAQQPQIHHNNDGDMTEDTNLACLAEWDPCDYKPWAPCSTHRSNTDPPVLRSFDPDELYDGAFLSFADDIRPPGEPRLIVIIARQLGGANNDIERESLRSHPGMIRWIRNQANMTIDLISVDDPEFERRISRESA